VEFARDVEALKRLVARHGKDEVRRLLEEV
jgi:hypothetical protein